MTIGIILSLILGGVALALVLAPILRSSADTARADDELGELRELHAQQQMLLSSLKDLEDDHDTNKISEEDYQALKARLSAEAVDVMRRLDVLEQQRQDRLKEEARASRPIPYPGGRTRSPAK